MATRVPIAIGAVSIDRVEITQGLQEGDAVVVSGDEAFERAASAVIR